jgi:hypothetical protein
MSPSSTSGRISLICVAVLAFSALFGSSASADPGNAKNAQVIPLTCGDTTYTVIVNGNGAWTPAHDSASNTVFVPVWFGEFSGTITDENGNVVDSFTEPATTKGAGNNADIECTYSVTNTFQDPELGPGTFTFSGSGSVRGIATPRSH